MRRAWRALPHGVRARVRLHMFTTPAAARPRPFPLALRPPRAVGSRTPGGSAETPLVSVVLPTLNPGPDFERVLAAIAAQEDVKVELIVLDSESDDGTSGRAASAGARVETVRRDEFRHGAVRDHGASLAAGDPIVMLVQDALLLGPHVLRTLAHRLAADPELAAVSARQVPRSDADLYGAFVVWAHERAVHGADAAPEQRARRAAAVDHVCAALRREAWSSLRIADRPFAEDLDFGVRALRAGWRLAVAADAVVAHSHARDPIYHLRRNVVDRVHVAPLVGDAYVSRVARAQPLEVAAAARAVVRRVEALLALWAGQSERPLGDLIGQVAAKLADAPRLEPTRELRRLDEYLARLGAAEASREEAALLRELGARLEWPLLVEFAGRHAAI